MNVLRVLPFIVSVLVLTWSAWAQDSSPRTGQVSGVSGVLETLDGKRLPHRTIRITNLGGTTTTDSGEFMFNLYPKILPGQPIELSVEEDLVISSPYEGRTFVPQAGNPIHVRVAHKGDPELLADPNFVEKIVTGVTSRLATSHTIAVAPPESYLESKAQEIGFTVQQIRAAIDLWISRVEGPYEKGLAALYQQRFAEASQLLKQSIASSETDLFAKYLALANAELAQGHYREGEEAVRKALAIKPDYAAAVDLLGSTLALQERFSEAESAIKLAIDLDTKTFGEESPSLARDLFSLGTLYNEVGRFPESAALLKQALAIVDKSGKADDLWLLPYLVQYADVLRQLGKYPQAQDLAERALSIANRKAGQDSLEAVGPLVTLGLIYKDIGLYGEAIVRLQQAEIIDEKQLGPSHPDVGRDLTDLGSVEMLLGNNSAEALLKRALSISQEAGRGDTLEAAGALCDLGIVYEQKEKYLEARDFLEQALTITRNKLGPSNYRVALLQRQLAIVSCDEKKFDEAEKLLISALGWDEKNFGPDHSYTAEDHALLGFLYYSQGEFPKAKSEYVLAYDAQLKSLGPNNQEVHATASRIADTLRKEGRDAEAVRYDCLSMRVLTESCEKLLTNKPHE